MTEPTSTSAGTLVTGAASAASSAAITAGMPPQEVILWAVMGALVAVWLDRQKGEALTLAWITRAIGMIGVSVLSGIAASACLPVLAKAPLISFLSETPRWVMAFIVAALIHKAGPLAYRVAVGKAKKQEAPDVVP